jgi:hypothetical protein
MLNKLRGSRFVSSLVAMSMLFLSIQPAVNAAIVSTTDLVADHQSILERDYLLKSLEREEVQTALVAQGVNVEQAKKRVASMTNAEVVALNSKMDQLPAGSGVIDTVVFIMLVLLITDIIGWTDVYPFVRK